MTAEWTWQNEVTIRMFLATSALHDVARTRVIGPWKKSRRAHRKQRCQRCHYLQHTYNIAIFKRFALIHLARWVGTGSEPMGSARLSGVCYLLLH